MGFASVYRCLQELFPQLDARLLKAVAIENSKDPDAAVEVLLEILPRMTENAVPPPPLGTLGSEPPPPLGTLGSDNHLYEEVQEEDEGSLFRRHRTVEKVNASQSEFPVNTDTHASSSNSKDAEDPALVKDNLFWDANDSIDQHEAFVTEKVVASKTAEETSAASLDQFSQAKLVAMHHFNVAKVPEEVNGTAEIEEVILLGTMNKPPTTTCQTSYVATTIRPDVDVADSGVCLSRTDEKDSEEPQAHSADGGDEHRQDINGDIALANFACQFKQASVQNHGSEADITVDVAAEYLNDDDIDTTAEVSDATSTVPDAGNEEALGITRSAQIGEVDLLEQIIEEAKNNKKTLFSAMESVINTMKEVEERETAAEQAREEAAQRSSGVCKRVEELKRMIQCAKEANDMHAGEVYGERSILATEVRELQSRLLNLSDERDRSLAVLDEMRNALEIRLTAAEEVIEAADREKDMKLEAANIAMKEQEALMEKVVHESKVLVEEAEENSKLREFLMDRGGLVDQLQGEIAVICQDVMLLKERFDSGVALSKSISYGQTSCILASASSSLNASVSSDRVSDSGETSKAPTGEPEDEVAAGAELKQLEEEGWEIFEN